MKNKFLILLLVAFCLGSCSSEQEMIDLGYEEGGKSTIGPIPTPLGDKWMKKMFIVNELDSFNRDELSATIMTLGTTYGKYYMCLIDTIIGKPISKVYQKKMNNAGTYDAENNTLAVLDNTDMKIQTYFEELIHAGQGLFRRNRAILR